MNIPSSCMNSKQKCFICREKTRMHMRCPATPIAGRYGLRDSAPAGSLGRSESARLGGTGSGNPAQPSRVAVRRLRLLDAFGLRDSAPAGILGRSESARLGGTGSGNPAQPSRVAVRRLRSLGAMVFGTPLPPGRAEVGKTSATLARFSQCF
jgi:hypothetical protein